MTERSSRTSPPTSTPLACHHLPLYRERGRDQPEWRATMPRLVELAPDEAGAQTLGSVLDLIGERPAAVFWIMPAPGRLFPHLRSINRVVIPDRRNDRGRAIRRGDEPQGSEWVTFRHADANVMAQVLPPLAFDETARLVGPAGFVAFRPRGDFGDGRWMRSVGAEERPTAPAGPLTLSRATLERIEAHRRGVIRKGVVRYVAENAPPELAGDVEAIEAAVDASERTAPLLGLKTAHARERWGYLNYLSDGAFARSPTIRAHLTRCDADPDRDMDDLVRFLQEG